MYSIIGVLKKPDSWTTKQFRKWWLTEHAEIAKKSLATAYGRDPSAIRLCMHFNIASGSEVITDVERRFDGPR